MLTQRHLSIIGAALQYWQEEMCPHGPENLDGYFPPGEAIAPTNQELTELRTQLSTAELRFAIVVSGSSRIQELDLFANLEGAFAAANPTDQVAVVLIPAATSH